MSDRQNHHSQPFRLNRIQNFTRIIIFKLTHLTMNFIHSSQLNIITQLHTDPIWEHGMIGDLLITKQEDGTFALCTRAKNSWIWAGNCPKCLALGVLHNPCCYCHKKESPCYNSIILYQGRIVQPFYLATCMAKPMDLPTKERELHRFHYD